MEAHYRESLRNDKRKNAFLFQPLIFYPQRLFLLLFYRFWQVCQAINHPICRIFRFWRDWLTCAHQYLRANIAAAAACISSILSPTI
jgi:hypothetical protein